MTGRCPVASERAVSSMHFYRQFYCLSALRSGNAAAACKKELLLALCDADVESLVGIIGAVTIGEDNAAVQISDIAESVV